MKIEKEDPVSFRKPLAVLQMLQLENGTVFPVCPRCRSSLDREYVNYCDRCGQRLDWKRLSSAEIIYSPNLCRSQF